MLATLPPTTCTLPLIDTNNLPILDLVPFLRMLRFIQISDLQSFQTQLLLCKGMIRLAFTSAFLLLLVSDQGG